MLQPAVGKENLESLASKLTLTSDKLNLTNLTFSRRWDSRRGIELLLEPGFQSCPKVPNLMILIIPWNQWATCNHPLQLGLFERPLSNFPFSSDLSVAVTAVQPYLMEVTRAHHGVLIEIKY